MKIILGKVRSFTSPGRGPSTGSDHCSVRTSGDTGALALDAAWQPIADLLEGHASAETEVAAAPGIDPDVSIVDGPSRLA